MRDRHGREKSVGPPSGQSRSRGVKKRLLGTYRSFILSLKLSKLIETRSRHEREQTFQHRTSMKASMLPATAGGQSQLQS